MDIDDRIRLQKRRIALGETTKHEVVISEKEYQTALKYCHTSGFNDEFERNSRITGILIKVT